MLTPRFLMVSALLFLILLIPIQAAVPMEFKPSPTAFQQKIKEIAHRFGVIIIADPSLNAPVPDTVKGDSIETTLKALLEPLGYSYIKVDDYYLVSGPDSPLAMLAEMDSVLVPVGFLDARARAELSEYAQYFTYDLPTGVAYVKAPSSKMNGILRKFWELSRISSQISVVYRLQIIDLGNATDLDFLFSAKYDQDRPDHQDWVITPNEWSVDSRAQIYTRQKLEEYSESLTRQPWMITLPGKTAQLCSDLHYIDGELDLNRRFTIKLTPLNVDGTSGRITSDISIERDMTSNSSLSQAKNLQINDRIYKVSSIIHTTPAKREILAVVRQFEESNTKMLWDLRRKKANNHRDIMILISAAPIAIQSALINSSGLIPVASLGNIGRISKEDAMPIQQRPFLELGMGNIRDTDTIHGWFNLSIPFGSHNSLTLDYRKEDFYSTGYTYYFDSFRETSFELLAGKGVGPDHQDAVLVGLGDETRPAPYLNLYAKYYPFAYLFDIKDYYYDGVWLAGTRLGTEKIGLSCTAMGDPGFEGWKYKIDIQVKQCTWLMEYNSTEQKPTFYFGVGLKF